MSATPVITLNGVSQSPSARICAPVHSDALHQGSERNALGGGREGRPGREGPVPCESLAFGAPAELESDAAKYEAKQHRDQRRIKRRQHHRVGQWKRRIEPAAAQHQPCLVAVPHWRDRVHCKIAIPRLEEGKEDANAEIESVGDDIGKHRKSDEPGPDEGEVDHARLRSTRTIRSRLR
jgi:hypothetical protein